MKRLVMAATLLLALALGLTGATSGPALVSAQDDPTCDDYSTYDEAYAAFESFGGPEEDPYGFDPDADGYPCEDVADAPVQAETAPPDAWPRDEDGASLGSDDATEEAEATEEPDDAAGDDAGGEGIGPLIGSQAGSDDDAETDEAADSTGTTDAAMGAEMPTTGSGPIDTGSLSLMTMLTGLAAVVALALSAASLSRGRR